MNIPCSLRSANQEICLSRRADRSTCSAFIVAALLAWTFSYPAAAQEPKNQVSSPESAASAKPLNPNPPAKNLAMPATSNGPALDSSSTQKVPGEVATASLISSVAIAPVGQRMSVRIEGKGRLDAQVVRLRNPERLVLDFAGTRLALQERVIPSDGAPIRSLRLGQYHPDVARLVINLAAAIPYEVAHDGSSFVIYLGAQATYSKPSKVEALHRSLPRARIRPPVPNLPQPHPRWKFKSYRPRKLRFRLIRQRDPLPPLPRLAGKTSRCLQVL